MKIKENYLHEALKSNKDDKPNRADEIRRQSLTDKPDSPNQFRRNDSPLKDNTKFSGLLDSPVKFQKPSRERNHSGKEESGDRKNEKNRETRPEDSTENATGDGKTEKYESTGGQTGGQSNFGMGGNVGHLNLSENFAARSILHIADLERMISIVRAQTDSGGRWEVVLRLKRSVLDGLSVRIKTGEKGGVEIEFLAANEKTRSQIQAHAEELAGILRGRGINLETLKSSVSLDQDEKGNSPSEENTVFDSQNKNTRSTADDSFADNTFDSVNKTGDKIYNA